MNLNDQYKADMAAHDVWMANSRKQSAEFEKTMRQIDADTARAEQILAAQVVPARRSVRRENPNACPSYGCFNLLGEDSGIIDGTEYCAGCVAAEAHEAGKAERLQDAEVFARGGGL